MSAQKSTSKCPTEVQFDLLGYLSQLPQWSGVGSSMGLDEMARIFEAIGGLNKRTKLVHVGGTNGKGSTAAATASILGAEGFSVGLYTSPHLIDVKERIVVNGWSVEHDNFAKHVLRIKALSEQHHIKLSHFEFLTAVALSVFNEAELDWVVIEVGLGGRLDATNIVPAPAISIITSIDYDHVSVLGGTLLLIAKEKAGIIKAGSQVVVGPMESEALNSILDTASNMSGVKLFAAGRDFTWSTQNSNCTEVDFNQRRKTIKFKPNLLGVHQFANMSLAAVAGVLAGVSDQAIFDGIANLFWPGRLEVVSEKPLFLLDSAHNPGGISSLINYLDRRGCRELKVGFGALETKDWQHMIKLLDPYVAEWVIMKPDDPKGVLPDKIVDFINMELPSKPINVLGDNYIEAAALFCRTGGLITGSIYLLGAIRKVLIEEQIIKERALWKRRYVS